MIDDAKTKCYGRPKPKIEDPMGKLKRLFCYIFKNYGPHCVFVLVCIIISVLANVQGTMFTQSLIDDYIVPLTKTAHPNFGPLARRSCRWPVFMELVLLRPMRITVLWLM